MLYFKNIRKLSGFLIWTVFIGLSFSPANAQKDLKTVTENTNSAQFRGVALVIGNSEYQNATKLNSPVNDAEDMAKTLRNLGFKVLAVRKNSSLQEMENAVAEFGRELKENKGVGIFYYSGHGVQSKGSNYLIPVEASIPAEAFLKNKALDVDAVLQTMADATGSLKIVILDACRNNPFAKNWGLKGSAGDGLAMQYAPKGMLIAYATSPNDTAADGKGRNSLYTEVLLQEIVKPNVSISEMFNEVGNLLNDKTNGDQTPWISNSPVGRFCFAGCNANPRIDPESAGQFPTGERAFWREMEKRNTVEAYQSYLRQYPKGEFVPLANLRLSELKSRLEQANGHFNQGLDEATRKNSDKAIVLFSKTIELDPKKIAAYYLRGLLYMEKNEYDKALADYNKGIELDPNSAFSYSIRASIYFKIPEYDNAMADYSKAIELNPKIAEYYNGRASVYFVKREYDKALDDFTAAIKLDPQVERYYRNRAHVYDAIGRKDLAETDRQKAKDLKKVEEPKK